MTYSASRFRFLTLALVSALQFPIALIAQAPAHGINWGVAGGMSLISRVPRQVYGQFRPGSCSAESPVDQFGPRIAVQSDWQLAAHFSNRFDLALQYFDSPPVTWSCWDGGGVPAVAASSFSIGETAILACPMQRRSIPQRSIPVSSWRGCWGEIGRSSIPTMGRRSSRKWESEPEWTSLFALRNSR